MLLNFKKTLFLLVAIIVLVIFSSQVFSYDTNIAHPYLTQKAIKLFNNNNNNQKISNQEMQWIIQGAKEEDTPIRWMNHYYNPITNKGLWNFSSAKDWSKQNIRQMLYSKGNQTWQKALQEYRNNNKKQAFIALGHILHLIEDMAVPAHTRLDPHVLGDPYEQWVKNNKPDNLNNNLLVKFANLDTAFDELAKYSNEYFLSKDTVDINENQFTEKIINKKIYLISKDNEGNNYKLIEKKIVVGKVFYNFDIQVHADYHSLLAPKAISYSAGVIDLFFEQTEAYNSQRITHNSQPETQNTQLTTQNTQQQNTEIQKHENTKTQKQEEEQEEAKTEETDRGSTSKIPEVEPLSVSVSRIIDGDTIELSTGEKVRYIGIDTPELNKQGPDDDECLAWEARMRNAELLSKGKVYLVKDPGVDKDKYGRLLRYVYAVETKSPKDVKAGSPALTSFGDLVSTTFINAQLVQEGFAKTFFCKPGWTDCPLMVDDQRKQIIMSAERLAEDNGYGIFGVCEDQMSEVRNRISDIGNQKTKDNNKITDDRQQTTNNNLQTDKEIKKEKETDNQKSRIDNPKKPFPFWLFGSNGDTTAPIITITSSPPAISSSTTANFQFSSDEKNVIFLLRQGYRGQVGEGDDSWQECSANIEINNLNNNQHSLEIKAIDQSGNKSVAITHSWLVDTIAPTSTINNLEQEYATSSFLVSWTGEDVIASSTASSTEISGLANYDLEYKIATGTEEWINWISATTSTSAAFNITVENNQNIYFKIRARDNAGNVGEWSNEAETKIDDNIASHVVISEFAVQGLSDSYDEFVELYNPTNFEVDITGWKLQYKSADGTNWSNKTGNNGLPSLFIKPRGFLLLAGKDYSLNASPDYWHNANWGLANNAGHIRIVDIVDKEDIEIDKIGYGNAIDPEDLPFMENIISGKSAERKANKNSTSETIASSTDKWTGNGFDSNNNSVDFIVRNTSDPQNSDSPTEPRSESPIFPETIQDLTVLHLFTSTSSMKLSWSSSNNSNINTGAFYDIRYNESVEDECELINNWHLANKVEESLPVPLEEEGIEQEVLINNLSPGKEYCFGIRVFNGSFWSFPSNIVNATTKTSQTQLTKIITVGNPKNIIITQTLTPDKSPYYIDYSLYLLPVRASTGVLTIKPGVVIKFGSGRQGQWSWERVILFVNGLIKANGTEKNPIVFTSIYDDDYGGDSNGDGPTPVPDSAIWNSFQINSGGNVFNHNIFRYGGFDNRGIITFYNASTLYHENNLISNSIFDNNINGVGFRAYASDKQDIIQNNIFRNFQNSAISFLATDKSNPIITHNNFLNNKTAFLVERSHLGAPIINYNNIYGNNYGVKNINIDSCFAINAKHNWWGSETGPNNILNPDGQGDQIYGDVDYSEWVITEL